MKGYTQTDLARLTGISIGILGAVERGTRVPDEELIDKVARVLEIDRSELE